MQGPGGKNFGEKISLKVKVVDEFDEILFYQTAVEILEDVRNLGISFTDVTSALKEAKYDPEMAKGILISNVQDKSIQEQTKQ